MATSYPGAIDTLTNPITTDPLTAPSHAGQHADVNDAIEAVETKLGTGASTPTTAGHALRVTGAGATAYGALVQAASVNRTAGDYATTSTTFVDVDTTNVALTITTEARRVLIGVIAVAFHNTNLNDVLLDVTIDGTRQGGTNGLVRETIMTASTDVHNLSFTFLSAPLTAASHTFRLQWRVNAGTGTLRASTSEPLHFFVVEQPT